MKSFEIPCVGYSVAADLYEKDGDEIILMLIGYSSSKAHQEDFLTAITDQTGMLAVTFDYTGHGESPFDLPELRPAQNFLEVITAFDWIKEKYPNKTVNVIGSSYGGYLATQLTKYRKFNKLVLRVPAIYRPQDFYTKWKNIDREELRQTYRKDTEALANHPLLKRASNFKGKTLVVVHGEDELVPQETTDAFIKTFHADTYIAEGFTHSFRENLDQTEKIAAYQKTIADWLKG